MTERPIGEVTRSTTTRFDAVCHEVFEPPRFGSFVKVESRDTIVYGIVGNVETASFDSQRRPVAFGMPWEQLAREQPQLVELLQTAFDTTLVGYSDAAGLHHHLPPHPPRVHDAVHACDPTEVAALTDSLDFIRTLSRLDAGITEELIAAAIREASLARGRDPGFLSVASRAVADLYKDDYDTAMAIVRRIS
ncbi:MAG: HAS-barrel domain-containing protein [Actinomycetota bacterium]|nr:hypothetical protein [Actinomycetota bacterium]